MKIALCGSMVFSDKMVEVAGNLKKLGHRVILPQLIERYQGKTADEITKLAAADKKEHDCIRQDWIRVRSSEGILVLNYDHKGVPGYIGGNTLLEMSFAHVLFRLIFLLQPIPDIAFYRSEIEAMNPVVIENDFSKIQKEFLKKHPGKF